MEVLRLVIGAGRLAVFLDQAARFIGVFLADQDDHAADTGEHILNSFDRGQVGVDARGIEQALDDEGFRFLFRVEYLDQLFVGIGTLGWGRGTGTFCHKSSTGVA